MPPHEIKLLTIPQAMAVLGVSRSTLYRYLALGAIASYRDDDGTRLVRKTDLLRFQARTPDSAVSKMIDKRKRV